MSDPTVFGSADAAAWIGITPRENSTGGRARPGRISRAGDQTLRWRLLVLGATAVIRQAKPGRAAPWLIALLAGKPQLARHARPRQQDGAHPLGHDGERRVCHRPLPV